VDIGEPSQVNWDPAIRAFVLLFNGPPARTGYDRVSDLARRFVGTLALRRVRAEFPNLAVVFRDGNVQKDIITKVDIRGLQAVGRLERLSGPEPYPGKRPQGSRSDLLLANLGTEDAGDLPSGLEQEMPPAAFVFCASGRPLESRVLREAVSSARDWDGMMGNLARICDAVVSAGPDADYFVVASASEDALRRISSD
jgi:hypothetical protein